MNHHAISVTDKVLNSIDPGTEHIVLQSDDKGRYTREGYSVSVSVKSNGKTNNSLLTSLQQAKQVWVPLQKHHL